MFQLESEDRKRMPSVKAVRQEEFSLTPGRLSPFFYSGLINWTRPTHAGEGNLLDSAHCLICHLIPKHPQTPRVKFEQTSGHPMNLPIALLGRREGLRSRSKLAYLLFFSLRIY